MEPPRNKARLLFGLYDLLSKGVRIYCIPDAPALARCRSMAAPANGEPVDYRFRLVTTIPNYGGRRCWFLSARCRGPRTDLHLMPGAWKM